MGSQTRGKPLSGALSLSSERALRLPIRCCSSIVFGRMKLAVGWFGSRIVSVQYTSRREPTKPAMVSMVFVDLETNRRLILSAGVELNWAQVSSGGQRPVLEPVVEERRTIGDGETDRA